MDFSEPLCQCLEKGSKNAQATTESLYYVKEPLLFRPAVLSTSPGRALGLEANTERLHEFTEKYLDDSDLGTTTEPKPR